MFESREYCVNKRGIYPTQSCDVAATMNAVR